MTGYIITGKFVENKNCFLGNLVLVFINEGYIWKFHYLLFVNDNNINIRIQRPKP